MKYPLDCESSFQKTYLFWLTRFIKNKITSLSNRNVKDKNRLSNIIQTLSQNLYTIIELQQLVKEIRNLGINSIHVYFIPLEKLFNFLTKYGAASMKEIDEDILSDFLASETANLSDATKKIIE